MVNKKFCLGMILIVLVLVFGMTVVGCNDDIQIVASEYAKGPNKVRVSIGKTHVDGVDGVDVIMVGWSAVSNALSYDVYGQDEGFTGYDNDIKYFSNVQANGMGIGGQVDIPISKVLPVSPSSGKWRFGVIVTDIDKNHVPSKIVWSEYINITNP